MMNLETRIRTKLTEALKPERLDVINESGNHKGRPGAETHFKVVVVSEGFEGRSPIQRHRTLYALLAEEMRDGVHALTLHTFTPAEWAEREPDTASPPCRGGSRHDTSRKG